MYPTTDPEPEYVTDHLYVFTIAGRCGRHGCEKPESVHPIQLSSPDPLTECDIDHRSVHPAYLLGDDGWSWSRCPRCATQIEPGLATGVPVGNTDGLGRGLLSFRLTKRLKALKGWFEFNGGNA